MTVRKRRKFNKLRGQRTHGKGNTKNRRGSGSRGGKGRAGSHKHKYSKYYMSFGRTDFLKAKAHDKVINLQEIENKKDEWLQQGLLTEEDEYIIIDGKRIGYDKLLGLGNLSFKAIVRNLKVSSKAREKIEENEGEIEEKNKEKLEKAVE